MLAAHGLCVAAALASFFVALCVAQPADGELPDTIEADLREIEKELSQPGAPPVSVHSNLASGLKIYTYPVPPLEMNDLRHQSQWFKGYYDQYQSIEKLMRSMKTLDPQEADAFFVPVDLIFMHWHSAGFAMRDAISEKYLTHLNTGKKHILFDATDEKKVKAPLDYWTDPRFIVLAFESVKNLNPKDIGMTPIPLPPSGAFIETGKHASKRQYSPPHFNLNALQLARDPMWRSKKKYLYSFIGSNKGANPVRTNLLERVCSGAHTHPDCLVSSHETAKIKLGDSGYLRSLTDSVFCPSPRGIGQWTWRLYEAITFGCIPVLLADKYVLPFPKQIPWEKFSVSVGEENVERLDDVLRSIPSQVVEEMHSQLLKFRTKYKEESVHQWVVQELKQRLAQSSESV